VIHGIISADLKKERKKGARLSRDKIFFWCGFVGMKGACADACFYLGGSHKDRGISSH